METFIKIEFNFFLSFHLGGKKSHTAGTPLLMALTNTGSSEQGECSKRLDRPHLCGLSFAIKNAGLRSDSTAQIQGHLRSLPLLCLCLKCSVGVNFWKKCGILKLSSSKLDYKSFMEINNEKIHFFFIGLICLINALGTHSSINASNLLKLNYPSSMSWIKMT